MADPLYPNVPIALGIPPVLRPPGQIAPPDPRLRNESRELDVALAQQQWGIFTQDGDPVVDPDNVASIDDGIEYRIANYPLEAGSFESYNKVTTPREIRIAMTKGGTLPERQDFLKTLKALEPKLDLYNVSTPEETFLNMNIAAVRKSRTQSSGATMLTVEVTLQEIRIAAPAAFSNSKEPSGADPVNNGQVQTTGTTIDGAGFPAFVSPF